MANLCIYHKNLGNILQFGKAKPSVKFQKCPVSSLVFDGGQIGASQKPIFGLGIECHGNEGHDGAVWILRLREESFRVRCQRGLSK